MTTFFTILFAITTVAATVGWIISAFDKRRILRAYLDAMDSWQDCALLARSIDEERHRLLEIVREQEDSGESWKDA